MLRLETGVGKPKWAYCLGVLRSRERGVVLLIELHSGLAVEAYLKWRRLLAFKSGLIARLKRRRKQGHSPFIYLLNTFGPFEPSSFELWGVAGCPVGPAR